MTLIKNDAENVVEVPVEKPKLVKLALANDRNHLLNYLTGHSEGKLDDTVQKFISRKIKRELKGICATENTSTSFKSQDVLKLDEFKYESQYKELKSVAPFTCTCIVSIAQNPRERRNKIKTFENNIPAIMNCVNTLFMCRNKNLNQ